MSSRYFAIFGAMRTGSNLLEKTLEALGDTVCYGEAFNPAFIGGPEKLDERGWTPATRDADPLGFLADLVGRDTRLSGFRIFKGHTEAALRFALSDPDCARIILTRDPLESYISLAIARQTNQWVLRFPRRRISTRVRFDPDGFAAYRDGLEAHYAWMDEIMSTAGTDALRIDYADLASRDALSAVVQHIGSEGALPKAAPLLKQNPGPLSQKISNYAEMCDALGLEPEESTPDGDVLAREMPQILSPDACLFAYAPIDGPGFGPGVAFLHWLDRAAQGTAGLPHSQILDTAARGELFPPVSDEDLAGRVVFTFVADPLDRLYALLIDELFGPGWKHAMVRRMLGERVGRLPEGRGALRDPNAFSVEIARAVLRAFVDLVEASLCGSASLVAPMAWRSQAEQIAGYETRVPVTRVVPIDAAPRFIRRQCARIGAPVPSVRDVARMLSIASLPVPGIEQVADEELRTRIRRLYADDYEAFSDLLGDGPGQLDP